MLNYQTLFELRSSYTRVVRVGNLRLPTGRVFCCDPFLSHEVRALETNLSPGLFNVDVCVIELPDWGHRVALARLHLSRRNVVEWKEAMFTADATRVSEFRVDAGLACFMDEETQELFVRIVDDFHTTHPDRNYYDDVLAAEFKRNADPTRQYEGGDWALHFPLKGDPRCIAMFASGLGDGTYPAYWGLSDDGEPAMLVADFGLLSPAGTITDVDEVPR